MKDNPKKQIFLSVASFAVFSSLVFSGFFGWHKAITSWIPETTKQEQFVGTSQVINATFKSAKDLKNVKFWLTPGLNKYTKIEPQVIEEVKKNQEYPVSIIVSIPIDFKTRKHNKDNLKENLKSFLQKDYKEKDYKKLREHEEFLRELSPDKIKGLVFVVSEKQRFWSKFRKHKHTIKKLHPLPLRVVVDVKEPSAEEIPVDEVALPVLERIYEDEETGAVYVQDEIIIGFEEGILGERIKEIVAGINGTFLGSIPDLGMYQVRVSDSSELETVIQQLESCPEVGVATYSWINEIF